MKSALRWLLLTALLPWLLDWFYVTPLYRIAINVVPVLSTEVAANLEGGDGHGVYCAAEGENAIFLGRDLPDTPYTDFEMWCEDRGGDVGWTA
jgi:hypothetical protein